MKSILRGLVATGLFCCAALVNAAQLDIDVSGIYSNDEFGNPINEVRTFNIGANSHVTGIGWNVTLTADSPSWLSEMVVRFSNSAGPGDLNLTVGVGDDAPGTASYDSGGIVDIVGVALDFNVLADGVLRLEFFESFDDFADDWDGLWERGIISVQYQSETQVPEPGSLALLGLSLAGLALSRRRKQ